MEKINSAEMYQYIYDNMPTYGEARDGHSPALRVLPHYKDWILKGALMDLGSGTGQAVEHFRENGIDAYGIDFINPRYEFCKQGNITLSMDLKKYNTVTCFDVIEHISNAQVKGLFENMVQVKRQIFTIANTPSYVEIKGKKVDLHINKKDFKKWRGVIRDYFDIFQEIEIRPYQRLYLCEQKNGDQVLIDYLKNKGYNITKYSGGDHVQKN